ncbi:MAG TPA: phospholipase D-like domain-containing protein [Terriglobales bacterium]|nr:phospholipase D-like domain-containing protein [Terriglobales bacterium]
MRLSFLACVVLIAGASYPRVVAHRLLSPNPTLQAPPLATDHRDAYYSPADNLERLDIQQLRQAQRTVDIAMYAFTDKYLAQELLELARRGVRIRLYRDRSQYQEEQRHAAEHAEASCSDILHQEQDIQIRVKNSSERDLMHLKAYVVDGGMLREGSANWSPAGLKRQDNSIHFITDVAQVKAFERDFEQMWNRADNLRVQ